MQTWAIMLTIQASCFAGAIALILWFMFRKNDPLDEKLQSTKEADKQ